MPQEPAPAVSTPTANSARERILKTANDLFYEEGIRAVGIDKIIERSGVAKMTLYRHFASKDELVVAYLEALDARHWDWLEAAVGAHPNDPRAQVLAVFDALVTKLSVPEYRGCAFTNVVTEFPDPAHPGRQVALAHVARMRERLTALAREAGAQHPEALGDQLMLLLDGAYVLGQKAGGALAATRAREMARVLLDASL